MEERLRCAHCEDVIGVYEPMIVVRGGLAHSTSQAAEGSIEGLPHADCYHDACFARARNGEGRV
jgi:hypothetical protein